MFWNSAYQAIGVTPIALTHHRQFPEQAYLVTKNPVYSMQRSWARLNLQMFVNKGDYRYPIPDEDKYEIKTDFKIAQWW